MVCGNTAFFFFNRRRFLKGAEQGDAVCAFNVGVMYNNALGTSFLSPLVPLLGGGELLRSLARYVRVLGVTKNLREAIRWLLLAEEKGYDDVPDTMNDIIGESAAALLPILTEKAEEGTHLSFLFFFLCYLFIIFINQGPRWASIT